MMKYLLLLVFSGSPAAVRPYRRAASRLQLGKASGRARVWNPVHLVLVWQYKAVCTGTSLYVRFWRHGGTRNLILVSTSMYWHRKFLGPYVPGCSCMYCPVLSWYKVVQGGTRWYMTVQGTPAVYGGTWRYMAVQESVKLYILVCTGTYLFLRFNLDPAGFAAAMLPGRRRCIKDQCI
jgi:hypothetical protein